MIRELDIVIPPSGELGIRDLDCRLEKLHTRSFDTSNDGKVYQLRIDCSQYRVLLLGAFCFGVL